MSLSPTTQTKVGTVALAVASDEKGPVLVDYFSDEREIATLDLALKNQDPEPLETVYSFRERQIHEDDEFGDYVEDLLSRPFLKDEVRDHGLQWLHSKIKIERFQKNEREASRTIADFAFRLYSEDPSKEDFLLASHSAAVRILILKVPPRKPSQAA
jgi:hypothetical protein